MAKLIQQERLDEALSIRRIRGLKKRSDEVAAPKLQPVVANRGFQSQQKAG
jgi:hypothetical protein